MEDMANRHTRSRRRITRGTRNVFADLGFPDAEARQVRLRLAYAVVELLVRRKLSDVDATKVLSLSRAELEALRNYKLAGFSIARLMTLMTVLGQDVDIVIRSKPRSRTAARIRVVVPDTQRSAFNRARRRALARLRAGLDLQWAPPNERG